MPADIQPWPLVKKGHQNHPVKSLQYLLRQRGQRIDADGIFGAKTDEAVRAFQRSKNLTADGIVGPNTWSALVIQVKRGSQGDAVRAVQYEFIDFRDGSGNPDLRQIDGIFGPRTDAEVRGFQEALELSVDGIVGPLTWRALVSGMLSL